MNDLCLFPTMLFTESDSRRLFAKTWSMSVMIP